MSLYNFTAGRNSEDQGKQGAKLRPGVYHADVISAIEKTSKNGNPMLELTLQLSGLATSITLVDRLVLTTAAAWRIESFVASTGRKFKKGENLPFDTQADTIGKHVVIETCCTRGNNGGLFAEVSKYVPGEHQQGIPMCGREFSAEDLAERGLDKDGCKPDSQPPAQPVPRQQQGYAGGYQPATHVQPASQPPMPHENEDDIPF